MSCAGVGGFFILTVLVFDVSARGRYLGESPGGDRGVIAINRASEVAFVFNFPGLKRALAGAMVEAQAMF